MTVVGWTDCYSGNYPVATFTAERKKALVERIKKRRYDFNYTDHCFLPYCAPVYDDEVVCELTKPQWDNVMSEAYKDATRNQRLLPQDVLGNNIINGVLLEKDKFRDLFERRA